MLVYIIKSDLGLGIEYENRYATLDKEIAKQIIQEEILYSDYDGDRDEQKVKAFAQDLVDGNTDNHYSDEFEGVCIWCDIMFLKETIQIIDGK